MSVLVTGGAGFLGKEIPKQLRERFPEVKIYSLQRGDCPELERFGVQSLKGDLANDATYSQLLKDMKIDTIFHVAAKAGIWGKKSEYIRCNIESTQKLLKWSKEDGVRYFIYTSTPSVVFNREAIENGNELLPYASNPLTDYAATKIAAEKEVLSAHGSVSKMTGHQMQTLAIRPHLIWGNGDPHLLKRLREMGIKDRLVIVGNGQNLIDITHVSSAAHAHILAWEYLQEATKNGGKAYFVGQERPIPMAAFIQKVLSQYQIPFRPRFISLEFAYFLGFISEIIYSLLPKKIEPPLTRFVALQMGTSHYFSHSQAYRDFAYRPKITIDDGIRDLKN